LHCCEHLVLICTDDMHVLYKTQGSEERRAVLHVHMECI
jgi:hypothetical protein